MHTSLAGAHADSGVVTASLAFDCYDDWRWLMAPLFHKITQFPINYPGQVQRLFGTDLHFVISSGCEEGILVEDGLVLAGSVLALMPMATVDLLVPDAATLMSTHSSFFRVLEAHQMESSLGLHSTSSSRQASSPSAKSAVDADGHVVNHPVATHTSCDPLLHQLPPVANGRIVVYLHFPGHVWIGSDFVRRSSVQDAVHSSKRSGPLSASLDYYGSHKHLFVAIDTARPQCGQARLRAMGGGCVPELRDSGNMLGLLAPLRLSPDTLPTSALADTRVLCEQPLWVNLSSHALPHTASLCRHVLSVAPTEELT